MVWDEAIEPWKPCREHREEVQKTLAALLKDIKAPMNFPSISRDIRYAVTTHLLRHKNSLTQTNSDDR